MKPAPFRLHTPQSVEEAVELLSELGDEAKALAGGQSLVPLLSLRLARFDHLIDLNRLSDLSVIQHTPDVVSIGALVRQAAAEHDLMINERTPLLSRALPLIGHFQTRNRGTVGGSLAHADPASELPAVLLALDGSVVVAGRSGQRRVPALDFFVDRWVTSLGADELLVTAEVPVWPGRSGFAVDEVARRHGDFAMAGVAVGVAVDTEGRIVRAGIGLFGVAPTPVGAETLRDAVVGLLPDDVDAEAWRELGQLATQGLEPMDDIHATGAYRRDVAGVLTGRALRQAWLEARHG